MTDDKPHDDISNSEGWQQAKEELDQKDLLMRIAFGIDELNRQIAMLRQAQSGESPEQVETYTCRRCGEEIPENDLESHAKNTHNWQEALGDIASEYK
jgi:RNA polymerase-binding transcription factor DksA